MKTKEVQKVAKSINPQKGDNLILFECKDFKIKHNVVIGDEPALLLSYALQIMLMSKKMDKAPKDILEEIAKNVNILQKKTEPFEEFV